MSVNYTVHECVIIVLTVQRACHQTCSGRLHSAVNGGVCGPGGKQMKLIGWGGGKALKHVCGAFPATSRVFVSSYRGSFPLVIHTVSLCISSSHSLLRGVNERREMEGDGGRGGSALALGGKRVRKGIRWDLSSRVWLWCFGVLSGACEAGNVGEFDQFKEIRETYVRKCLHCKAWSRIFLTVDYMKRQVSV